MAGASPAQIIQREWTQQASKQAFIFGRENRVSKRLYFLTVSNNLKYTQYVTIFFIRNRMKIEFTVLPGSGNPVMMLTSKSTIFIRNEYFNIIMY